MDITLIEELIEKITDGDKDAFHRLYNLYKNKIYKTALAIVNDEKAAEDILQDVFITVYTKVYKLKHLEAFESWLYRIVTNCCNAYFRKNKRSLSTEAEALEKLIDDGSNINLEDIIVSAEVNKELGKCVDSLSPKLKICIVLFYFNNMSIRQIADILECSEGTVKSRLFKAKRMLEKSLGVEKNSGVKAYVYR